MSQLIQAGDGTTSFFDVQATLDGATYTLEFRWNVRLGAWFLAILDETGSTPIQTGIRLVANWRLGSANVALQPPGSLFAHDTSGQGLDPGFEDLGTRVQLVYLTAAEMAG
jgi:hypothetical protein